MRLFHFSEDPRIACFVPRPVAIPSARPPGREWLNGSLVWAIEDARAPLYLFPRDCPRILLWRTPATTAQDEADWFRGGSASMIAYVEWAWFERLQSGLIHRYDLPAASFEALEDAGMWVSREPVTPLGMETITDLPAALAASGVELRLTERLTHLRDAWDSSLHVSGVRLRNAQDWDMA